MKLTLIQKIIHDDCALWHPKRHEIYLFKEIEIPVIPTATQRIDNIFEVDYCNYNTETDEWEAVSRLFVKSYETYLQLIKKFRRNGFGDINQDTND